MFMAYHPSDLEPFVKDDGDCAAAGGTIEMNDLQLADGSSMSHEEDNIPSSTTTMFTTPAHKPTVTNFGGRKRHSLASIVWVGILILLLLVSAYVHDRLVTNVPMDAATPHSAWTPVGSPLVPPDDGSTAFACATTSPWRVALSADGSILATAYPTTARASTTTTATTRSTPTTTESPCDGFAQTGTMVRLWKYSDNYQTWQQLGDDIHYTSRPGLPHTDDHDFVMALSADGHVVAVTEAPWGVRYVRVYKYDETFKVWKRWGHPFSQWSDDDDEDHISVTAMALSEQGNTLAVVLPIEKRSIIFVFEFDKIQSEWQQKGATMQLVDATDGSVQSLQLSLDGTQVMVETTNPERPLIIFTLQTDDPTLRCFTMGSDHMLECWFRSVWNLWDWIGTSEATVQRAAFAPNGRAVAVAVADSSGNMLIFRAEKETKEWIRVRNETKAFDQYDQILALNLAATPSLWDRHNVTYATTVITESTQQRLVGQYGGDNFQTSLVVLSADGSTVAFAGFEWVESEDHGPVQTTATTSAGILGKKDQIRVFVHETMKPVV